MKAEKICYKMDMTNEVGRGGIKFQNLGLLPLAY